MFFFSTMRRVWLIKGRRGGGGGLAGNRDFPGYIPVLSPTVNPINQSIKAMECFSEWHQISFRGMSKSWKDEGYWYISTEWFWLKQRNSMLLLLPYLSIHSCKPRNIFDQSGQTRLYVIPFSKIIFLSYIYESKNFSGICT